MSKGVPPGLMEWFKIIVRNKMSAIAAPVPGIAIGCTLISFAAPFGDPVHAVVTWLGLIMLILMVALFVIAAYRFVLYPPADTEAGSGGRGRRQNPRTPAEMALAQPRAPRQPSVGEVAAQKVGRRRAQQPVQPSPAEEPKDGGP